MRLATMTWCSTTTSWSAPSGRPRDHVGQSPRGNKVGEWTTEVVGGSLSIDTCLVVREPHPVVGIETEHAFADPVEHGLSLLEEPRYRIEFEPEGLALQAPSQE